MNKLLLLLPAAVAGLFFSGCVDDPYYGRVAYNGPGYYGGPGPGPDYAPGYGPGYGPDYGPAYGADYGPDYGPDVDFYYVGGRPYSHLYGELVFRDNHYYYNHGGGLVTYTRGGPGYRHGAYASDRRGPNYRSGTVQQQYRGGQPARGDYRTQGNYRGQVTTRGGVPQRPGVVNGQAVQQRGKGQPKKDENQR